MQNSTVPHPGICPLAAGGVLRAERNLCLLGHQRAVPASPQSPESTWEDVSPAPIVNASFFKELFSDALFTTLTLIVKQITNMIT